MKQKAVIVAVFLALVGGLAAFGYLLRQLPPRPCSCEMNKNHECAP